MIRPVPQTPDRAVIYVRQSSAKEESISLDVQETTGRDYAARMGYHVVDVVPDPNLSGRHWLKRKGVQRVMNMIQQGEADVIVLWRWSRLSRRRVDWAVAIDKVETLGGRVESATEPVDVATASGRFARGMLAEVSAFESERIGETWQEAHAHRRALGLPAMGGRKYGYRWIKDPPPERYEIEPDEAEALRWMYEQYIRGVGRSALSTALNRRGILNARGRLWTVTNVVQVMDSGFAAGKLSRTAMRKEKVWVPPFPERTWDDGVHEPVIDADTWERYKLARLERGSVPSRVTTPSHPLVGLLRCADEGCNARMHRRIVEHSRSGGPQFVCSAWRRSGVSRCVTVAENRVIQKVRSWLSEYTDEVNSVEVADVRRGVELRSRVALDIAARDVATIEKQLAQLTRQLLSDLVPESAFRTVRDELLTELKAAQQRESDAKRETMRVSNTDLTRIAVTLHESWEIAPPAEARILLGQLVKEIRIFPAEKRYGRARIEIIPTWAD